MIDHETRQRHIHHNVYHVPLNAIAKARQFALLLMDLHGADHFEGFSPPDVRLCFASGHVGQNTPPSSVLWYNPLVVNGTVNLQSHDISIVSRRAYGTMGYA